MSATVAAAVFERPRSAKAQQRDHALYEAACRMDWFTTRDLLQATGGMSWQSDASLLLRTLVREGHMRIASPEGSKPYVYEWVNHPGRTASPHVEIALSGVAARVAQIDRIKGDDHAAHAAEDELHLQVLRAIADGHPQPVELAQAALSTTTIPFSRWTA